MVAFDSLLIQSPKRSLKVPRGWDGFFPYYAGYPESFARALLKSADLPRDAIVLDPWNGSGTTTFSASQLGLASRGFDLNPVMIVIARARLLSPSEADSLEPLARDSVKGVRADSRVVQPNDPLLWWFSPSTAALIRSLERRIRAQLVGGRTLNANGVRLDHISGLAATFYVALFSVCRQLAAPFRSSNPTWLRKPKVDEELISATREAILSAFVTSVKNMADALAHRAVESQTDHTTAELQLADTSLTSLAEASADIVLTSPPYCTRIDYSAATRIELAVMQPLVEVEIEDLRRQMIGSTRVPDHHIEVDAAWGPTCCHFIATLKTHPSKASSGYYYKTHVDYFEKMARSLANISCGLKPTGAAILVVQDSYYKDIHNDLPGIITEMAAAAGLLLRRRDDFEFKRSMAGINPHTRIYKRAAGAVEAVLCFEKS
ncbi:hypothetical protein [Bosea sp. (in: a-proteobacteria)]|uniref:hypothetical protein n=1 Tax=Bosea sp. (in: a-proteobacteria) TaxID=1871050 RepID=UPI0012110EAD|nr:hypothetical protein [Bosea sp. (in: a-proteobacteria)]TAJ31047.1 MAG: site-specific DNA-methyltransferase [Bosea sp. (in: a-proteobacteria)]